MRIGAIEAQPGTKAYGAFKSGETHGRFDVHIPLHVIVGSQPGPTLVVQAGASGLEIEPSLILPKLSNRNTRSPQLFRKSVLSRSPCACTGSKC